MPQQGSESGQRSQQQIPQIAVFAGHQQQTLPQKDQFLAQLIFHLRAMQMHGDSQSGQRVVAEQNTMMALDVEQLNRKDISRMLQFFLRHDQRRRMLLFMPPLHYRRNRGKLAERSVAQNAE